MDEDMSLSQLFTATACSSTMGLSTWYLDIGATHNMTGTFEWLHDYTPLSHAMEVHLGDDGLYTAEGHGTIKIQLPSGDITVISRVHYIPGLVKNLLSVNELTSNGTSIEFFYKYCIIKAVVQHGRHTRVICPQEGRLFPLGVTCIEPQMQSNSTTLEDQNTSTLRWHFRLGHPHVQEMKTLRRFNMAEGFTSQISGIELCEACIYGKLSRTKFPKSRSKTTRLLELIHSDVCGPMQTASLTGNLYYLTFIDDFSKYTHIYFLKHKYEVFTHFQHFVVFVERRDVVFDEGSLLQHGGQNSFADLPPLLVDTSSSSAEVTTAHPTVSWWGLDEGTPLAMPPPNPPPQPPADPPHNTTPIRAASIVQTLVRG
ncbi:hypothetical protein L7F22_054212 [Adiantum nelumboides]|nr:hypothetical protein [Adiantum nelumboides]